jgi:Fe-S cluster assembly protein SufD
MSTMIQARESFVADFERSRGELLAGEPWLADLRRASIARFAEIGFPGPKNEDWKYTSVGPLLQIPFQRVTRRELDYDRSAVTRAVSSLPVGKGASLLVFVNGHYCQELSRPGSEAAHDLRTNLTEKDALLRDGLGRQLDAGLHGFTALNTAFFEDGAVVRVPRETAIAAPIHLLFYGIATSAPAVFYPRVLIVAEPGSRATVVEHYAGGSKHPYLTDAVTEIVLGANATLVHCKVQREDERAFHVHRIQVVQESGSHLRSHSIATGGSLSRTELATTLSGDGASCALHGLYMAGGRRHVDHHTVVDHAAPHTGSQQLYKGILDDSARGVFTGSVRVRRDAQRVSAEQTNKNLLLAPGAAVETRPQLEINADDVRCTHGATVGQLDEDSMFYLRQRGLDQASARALLTYGFATEVLASVEPAELRAALERDVARLGPEATIGPARGGRS